MVPSKECSCVSEITITRVEMVPGAMIPVRHGLLLQTLFVDTFEGKPEARAGVMVAAEYREILKNG